MTITTLEQYIDPTSIYNAPFRAWFSRNLYITETGCPWRGTTVCAKCPYSAYSPPVLCDWRCCERHGNQHGVTFTDCEHRAYCKCGHDQTERLKAWGLIA